MPGLERIANRVLQPKAELLPSDVHSYIVLVEIVEMGYKVKDLLEKVSCNAGGSLRDMMVSMGRMVSLGVLSRTGSAVVARKKNWL